MLNETSTSTPNDPDGGKMLDDSSIHNDPDTVQIGDMLLSRQQYKLLYTNATSRRHGYNEAGAMKDTV